MTILDDILEVKRAEVAALDMAAIEDSLRRASPPRGFRSALQASPSPAVIAEFKRASPSRGEIRPGADPAEMAAQYESAGAAALSVLTDESFFSGSLADLASAREATSLPVLRKDFTIDVRQVAQARGAGADAVLLIVAALSDDQLGELLAAATDHLMDALVEVHDEQEVDRAVAAGASLIGVNNRDLRTFDTDPDVTKRLLPRISGATVVSESGLDDPRLIAELGEAGVHAFLVGEALMRAAEPGEELERLRGLL